MRSTITGVDETGDREAKRVNKRWPATILAASRTDSVRGRIIFLTSSISTIKGIRRGGVPKGTRWANILLGVISHAILMWPTHRGSASATVKEICAEEVNTYGNRPKKLFNKINRNSLEVIRVAPGVDLWVKTEKNSS